MTTKIARNTFRDGLVMDLAPDNTQNTCLTSALNATIITNNGNEFSLLNDMGNGRVETAFLPEGYVPVGTCEFGDIIYIVSYNPLTNKSQIGCFPSPERNISSEEIENLPSAFLSAEDFQELDENGELTGNLKATSIRKIVYDKDLRPGDKYIIYDKTGSILEEKHISDIGNTEHIFGHLEFKKYVTIHVVSIEDSGKINYLDSTVKWYDRKSKDYFINISNPEVESDKPDIDSYRNLLSSGYSVFSSKVSGKLALLIELEKISGFDCTYSVYEVEAEGEEENKYVIYLHMNWESDNDKIYPKYAVLTSDNRNGLVENRPVVYPLENYWYKEITNGGGAEWPSIELGYDRDTGYPKPGFYNRGLKISDVIVNNKYKQSFCKKFSHGDALISVNTEEYSKEENLNSNLIYEFEITPAMEYGLLKEYAVKNTIDFSKINKKVAEITTYKYYVTDSEVIMKLGVNAYKPSYYDVKNITLDYYDNRGHIATYTIDNRVSYSGTFTLHIPISSSYKLSDSVFKYYDGKDIFPNYLYGVVISVNYQKKNTNTLEPVQFTRWMWTSKVLNSEFNKSTLDFKDITIELPLDLGSEFTYTEDDKLPDVTNDTSKTTGYHYTTEAKKLTLSHNLTYGLQNNWEGTFKLAKAEDCELSIGIGDRNVKNDECKIITSTNTHTGCSDIVPVNNDLAPVIEGAVSELKNGFTVECTNANSTGKAHEYFNSYGEVSSVDLYAGGEDYKISGDTVVGKTAKYEVTLYNYSKYHTIVDSSLLNTVNIYKRWIDKYSDLLPTLLKTVTINTNSDLYKCLFGLSQTISVNPNSVEDVLKFKDLLEKENIENGFFQIKLTVPQNNTIKFGLNNNLKPDDVSYNTAFSTYYNNIKGGDISDGPYFWVYKSEGSPEYNNYFFAAYHDGGKRVFCNTNYEGIFPKTFDNNTNSSLYYGSRSEIIEHICESRVNTSSYTLNASVKKKDDVKNLKVGEYGYYFDDSHYHLYVRTTDKLTKSDHPFLKLIYAFGDGGFDSSPDDDNTYLTYIKLDWEADPPFWQDEDFTGGIVDTMVILQTRAYDLYNTGDLGTFKIPAYIKSTIYKYNHKDTLLDTLIIDGSFYILCYKYDRNLIMFNQFSKERFDIERIKTALNNLYVYHIKETRSLDIIESVAFLSPYKTYYTLDLVYKLSPILKKDSVPNSQVCCLSAIDYNNVSWITVEQAVKKIKDNAETKLPSDLSWPELNIELKSCIKNIPVQFQLEYKQPNIVTQQQVSTGVCIERVKNEKIEKISCLLNDDESKKLWYFDSNRLVLLSLDSRYYYDLEGSLKANPYLYKTFLDYEGNLLIPVLHYDDGSESDYIGILNHKTSLEKQKGWKCVLEADPTTTSGSAVFKWYKEPNYIKDIYRYYVVLPDYKVLINDGN